MATSKQIKKITAHDLAFGIGIKATFEELKNLIKNESKNKGLSYIKNTIKYAIDSLWNAVSQKGMIISFSGVDGAGKSTVIEHTKHEIEKNCLWCIFLHNYLNR